MTTQKIKTNSKGLFRVNFKGLIHIAQMGIKEGVEVIYLWNYKTWNKPNVEPTWVFADIFNDKKQSDISIANI